MRAELVGLLEECHVLSEGLLALFAQERHLVRLGELVVLPLGVALGALRSNRVNSTREGGQRQREGQPRARAYVEPLLAAGSSDGSLHVEDVLAHCATRGGGASAGGTGWSEQRDATYSRASFPVGRRLIFRLGGSDAGEGARSRVDTITIEGWQAERERERERDRAPGEAKTAQHNTTRLAP